MKNTVVPIYTLNKDVSICKVVKYSLSHQNLISSYTVAIETGFPCSLTVLESKGKGGGTYLMLWPRGWALI